MPLRQTCDRCRDLKVRCKREPLATSDYCVRCLKAGALCVYNRKLQPTLGYADRCIPRLCANYIHRE